MKILQKPISDATLARLQATNEARRAEAKAALGDRYVCSAAATKQIKNISKRTMVQVIDFEPSHFKPSSFQTIGRIRRQGNGDKEGITF